MAFQTRLAALAALISIGVVVGCQPSHKLPDETRPPCMENALPNIKGTAYDCASYRP